MRSAPLLLLACAAAASAQVGDPSRLPVIVADRDDLEIDRSCRLVAPPGKVLVDRAGDGFVKVVADDVLIVCEGEPWRGSPVGTPPEAFEGCAVRIEGRRGVVVRNLSARGYRVALHATRADGLVVDGGDVSDNRAQRLRSTPETCDDGSDWLAPHDNDAGEWLKAYGAGVCVEDSRGAEIRDLVCRRTQNGIIFDRVVGSRVVDVDCSFLSGWGLALWRASDNVVSRCSFDFCVRGYSHGVYNRGQDSAGILLFEQCSRNVFVENSVTHGGDGLFGFAGREAIGDRPTPEGFDLSRRGCNDNVFVGNDFSDAAAHGLELTFSFGNRIVGNRFAGNAICGVWAGYAQETLVADNDFVGNGGAGYGLERGGVNIEHGSGNRIVRNRFEGNRCGVHLWGSDGGGMRTKPWGRANPPTTPEEVRDNLFAGDVLALHVREGAPVLWDGNRGDASVRLERSRVRLAEGAPVVASPPTPTPLGKNRPTARRHELRGRERIVMTEYGPWDFERPLAILAADDGRARTYRLVGLRAPTLAAPPASDAGFSAEIGRDAATGAPLLTVRAAAADSVAPFAVEVREADDPTRRAGVAGVLVAATWDVRFFPWAADPRTDEAAWRRGADLPGAARAQAGALAFAFGGGGPAEACDAPAVRAAAPPKDRFGLIATAALRFPAGRWRVATVSDDGVRVTADGTRIIDAWTWHVPQRDVGEIVLDAPRVVALEVAYFEIDGHATLRLDVAPSD